MTKGAHFSNKSVSALITYDALVSAPIFEIAVSGCPFKNEISNKRWGKRNFKYRHLDTAKRDDCKERDMNIKKKFRVLNIIVKIC